MHGGARRFFWPAPRPCISVKRAASGGRSAKLDTPPHTGMIGRRWRCEGEERLRDFGPRPKSGLPSDVRVARAYQVEQLVCEASASGACQRGAVHAASISSVRSSLPLW
jgi:hypothetical protein